VAVGFWINASSLTCQVAIGAGVLCGMVLLQPAAWLAAAPADETQTWPMGRGMHGMASADQRFIVMMGFPRFRGHRSGVHRGECTGSDECLLVVDRTHVADR
jgi:hypothetical protein